MLGNDWKVHSRPPKKQILTVVLQTCKQSAVKHFIEKSILLNFYDALELVFSHCSTFPFTTSKKQWDYYHHIVNIGVASRVAKQLKT